MSRKIGAFITDVSGTELSPEEKEILAHPLVGGVVLFTRNYESRAQLTHLCQQIRKTRTIPHLIMVDQEGGRVQRFIKDFTRLPAMGVLGKQYQDQAEAGLTLAKNCGWLMASELIESGIDLSLAPVLDMNKEKNTVIGNRAFHANADAITRLATAFMEGMQEAGMAATGKHFPGHGDVTLDSHVAMPVDKRTLEAIEKSDLQPFHAMVKAGIPAMMAAHIVFPAVDDLPVGYSRIWLHDILRNRLGFNGVIFSDDLSMEGANIGNHPADRVQAALEAGCDFALLCNNRAGSIQVLDVLPAMKYQVSENKWGVLSAKPPRTPTAFQENPRWIAVHDYLTKTMGSVTQ